MNAARFFSILSGMFFLFVLVFFFIRLDALRADQVDLQKELLQQAVNRYSDGGVAFLEGFGTAVPGRLRVAMLFSTEDGIYELWSRDPQYIRELPENLNRLRGMPSLIWNNIYEEYFEVKIPVAGNTAADSSEELYAASIAQVLSGEELIPILRQVLYLFLAYGVFTFLMLLIRLIFQAQSFREADTVEYYGQASPSPESSRQPFPHSETYPGSQRHPDSDSFPDSQPHPGSESDSDGGQPSEDVTRRNSVSSGASDGQVDENSDIPDESTRKTGSAAVSDKELRRLSRSRSPWPGQLLRIRLNNEIQRATENESDLGFAVLKVSNTLRKDESVLRSFEKLLLSHFRYEDLIFSFGRGMYALILPQSGQTETARGIEAFSVRSRSLFSTLGKGDIRAGFSTRSGRLMSGDRLLKESLAALKQSGKTRGSIIGFKPDPLKYRMSLGSSVSKDRRRA